MKGEAFLHIIKKINQVLFDVLIFAVSYFSSFIIRFEGIPVGISAHQLLILLPYVVLARTLSFVFFSIYSISWRYISLIDVISVFKATLPVSGLLLIARIWLPERLAFWKIPLSVIALDFLFVFFGALGMRMLRRLLYEAAERSKFESRRLKSIKKVLLIGAGTAGNMTIKELKQRVDLGMEVVGFIDDDPKKRKMLIQGVRVLGRPDQIPKIAEKYDVDEAVITIANASSQDIRRIVAICKAAEVKVKIIPGLFEILEGRVKITKIREINIDDLLGRSVIRFDNHIPEITRQYKGKRILVTGAGGSIGSELCRQLMSLEPRELILLDKDENSIFEIHTELIQKVDGCPLHPLIVDIKDEQRMRILMVKHRPEVVFHAAAHKHVPLMEWNVPEAILNNVCGTRHLAVLADVLAVETFINISTDKAVNPTSIMGASKKIAEMVIQEIAAKSSTRFSIVRFGNVLGSRGSVVQTFRQQIERGLPLTLTHPDIERYFMSISEAVQLIIQAGTLGNKGEIFALDMGHPVKILDLAKDIIRLSGQREEDIEIKYIGLRPGEKLYEEILIDEEQMKATEFKKIFIAPPLEVGQGQFNQNLDLLLEAAHRGDEEEIRECLKRLDIGYNYKKG
jgi:FlaA1/EpsC-like NDP-sugar epimerase